MILLVDRDILASFCSALGMNWTIIHDAAALFHTPDGPDFCYCSWSPGSGGDIRVELGEAARLHYLTLIPGALERRRQKLEKGVRGKRREVLRDEVTALIAIRSRLRD